MDALAQQRRHVPARVWQAARALYVSDPTVTLPVIAARFGVTLAAVKKHSSREKWREKAPVSAGGSGEGETHGAEVAEVPAVTTREQYREFLRTEAVEWMRLLRRVRLASGADPLDAIRQAAPLLTRLLRMEKAFDESAPPEHARKPLLSWDGAHGLVKIPPLTQDGDDGAE